MLGTNGASSADGVRHFASVKEKDMCMNHVQLAYQPFLICNIHMIYW